jgi:hypothetical protein
VCARYGPLDRKSTRDAGLAANTSGDGDTSTTDGSTGAPERRTCAADGQSCANHANGARAGDASDTGNERIRSEINKARSQAMHHARLAPIDGTADFD